MLSKTIKHIVQEIKKHNIVFIVVKLDVPFLSKHWL